MSDQLTRAETIRFFSHIIEMVQALRMEIAFPKNPKYSTDYTNSADLALGLLEQLSQPQNHGPPKE
jgi:hypothetical protein